MKQSITVEATLLYQQASIIADDILQDNVRPNPDAEIPADFQNKFFAFLGRITGHLMEDKDNFFGYFLFQMTKSIRFDLASPTGVNFKGTRYQIHFNPLIFLTLSPEQMESTIKHEILHVVSLHLIRAKELRENYSKQAITFAMDVVVNTYLDHLPPFSTTLEWVNTNFSLLLKPFESLEYYVDKIQTALDLRTENKNLPEPESDSDETVAVSYNPVTTHDLWDESDEIDDETLREFTEKYVDASSKGDLSNYLESMIKALKDNKDGLPWHWYLKKLVGSVASRWKRTPMRRNRRQPDRLDLPGKLRAPIRPRSSSPSTSAAASPMPNFARPSVKSCSSFAAMTTKSSSSNATTKFAAPTTSATWKTSKGASTSAAVPPIHQSSTLPTPKTSTF